VPDCGAVPLDTLFARVRAEFAAPAATRGLTFTTVATKLVVLSDASLLERIVGNLASNAIRYTNRGGVVIGARRCGDRVAIDVVDTGIGIARADRDHIFEEFFQVRSEVSSSPAHRGMGLGLAIVRRFAALLGHEIRLDSREGTGSRFRVLLPRVAPRESRAHRPRLPVATNASLDLRAFAGRLVAVIDDDSATVDAMRTLFETWGADVVGGATPDALLACAGEIERYPDLIVADLRLAEGRSGIEAVRRLRDEMGFAIPAIIVSGDTGTHADREARAANLTLLPKPVVGATLCAVAIAAMRRGSRGEALSA
jgi:CheY-like chemotaxis protein/anti-sigma regulatory factor (Ser/Thr protein kinase)